MQAGNLFGVLLFMLQTSRVQMVGLRANKGDGETGNRDLPGQPMANGTESASQGRSNQIVRKRPEVALLPDLSKRLGLAQSNDTRHRKRIGYKLGASRGGHHQYRSQTKIPQSGRVIDALRDGNGTAHCRDIEQNLNRFGAAFGMPEALDENRDDSDEHDFGRPQFNDYNEHKKEDKRHRALNARKSHLHGRTAGGKQEEDNEPERVLRRPLRNCRKDGEET